MTKHFSVIEVLKHSGKFNLVSIVSRIIAIPKTIIIAMVLNPADYGTISFLMLWSFYAGLINPGLLSARNREMTYLLGKGNEEKAVRLQNISQTSDLIYSIFPFLAIAIASFFFKQPFIRFGLMITAITFLASRFVNYWRGVNFARQRFSLIAKADLMQNLLTTFIIVILIWRLKIYAVLIAPLVAVLVIGIYYQKKGPIGFRFVFDWNQTLRLAKIGFPLAMCTLVYWSNQYMDRTVIATMLSLNDLGIYVYAMTYVMFGIVFFTEFGNVLTPMLWTRTGSAANANDVFTQTRRIAVYIALTTSVVIPFLQVIFYVLVTVFTVKYVESFPVFVILSYSLYLTAMIMIPVLILESAVVNKQALSLKIYILCLVLNIVFSFIAIKLNYGVLGVAIATIFCHGLNTILRLFFVRGYMLGNERFLKFLAVIGMPFVVSILFAFMHAYAISIVKNPWVFAPTAILVQFIFWLGFIRIFYPGYFPKENLLLLWRQGSEFVWRRIQIWRRYKMN